MIKIKDKVKLKKKTTIRKEWNKRIMGLIAGIYILVGVGAYVVIRNSTKNILLNAGPVFSYIISNELEGKNLNEIINEGENNAIYKKVDKITTSLQSRGKDIFNSIYLINKNPNGEWKYIIDRSQSDNKKLGDTFSTEYSADELKEAEVNNKAAIKDKNGSELSVFIPINMDGNSKVILGMDFNLNTIKRIELIGLAGLIALLLISMLIIRLIVGAITKKQTHSITVLVDKMKEMANLEGDLTKRIEIESNDEIGELALYTNKMLDTIQNTLKQVNSLSIQLNNTTEDFTNAFSKTVEEFGVMNTGVKNISGRIESQTEELAETSERVIQINNVINGIADNSQKVTEQAATTSENAVEGNKVMDKLEEHSKEIASVVNNTSELVKNLGDKSEEINGIADTIGSIASQTNLLALNASIEAARAGEHGKGFAVVAEEVRKLAEESSESAKNIFALIQEVRQGIENAAASMEHVSGKTSEQSEFVKEVTAKFNDIVYSINNVSENVEEVSASTEEMSSNINMITAKFEDLTSISEENNSSTGEISSYIESQSNTIKNLSSMIKELNSKSSELADKLLKMKLD